MLRGFDVSHWQGAEDWPAMKARYDLSFGAAKAAEGLRTVDERFDENWASMQSAGLVRLAYYFAHPDQDDRAAADHLLSVVTPRGLEPTDVLVLDLETTEGIGTSNAIDWSNRWADRVRAETGAWPIIYAGSWVMESARATMLREHFAGWWYPRYPSALADSATWPAAFNPRLPDPNHWGGSPDVWQFSQSFPVGGEAHDANVFSGDLAALRSLNRRKEIEMFLVRADNSARVFVCDGVSKHHVLAGTELALWRSVLADDVVHVWPAKYVDRIPHSDPNVALEADVRFLSQDANDRADVVFGKQVDSISTRYLVERAWADSSRQGDDEQKLTALLGALSTAEQIADAVMARHGSGPDGCPTLEEIRAAVAAELAPYRFLLPGE